jgi:hypothetical protein
MKKEINKKMKHEEIEFKKKALIISYLVLNLFFFIFFYLFTNT